MNARAIRRAAERQANKFAKQNPKQSEGQRLSPKQENAGDGKVCVGDPTGPGMAAGQAISCRKNSGGQGVSLPIVPAQQAHGLTGSFRVLKSESQELFCQLRNALRAEHAPASPTEVLLVDRMAEHVWLSQRAQIVADSALLDMDQKWLSLMLRYRATHDRAFHKCLAELRTVRRERERDQNHRRQKSPSSSQEQFESQNAVAPPETALEFESQTPRRYTEEDPQRLSFREVSALTQAALRRANLNLDDFAHELEAEELRIATSFEAIQGKHHISKDLLY